MFEYLIATLGIKRLIGLAKTNLLKRDLRNAAEMSEDIKKLTTAVVKGETNLAAKYPECETSIQAADIPMIRKHIQEMDSEKHIADLMAELDESDIGVEAGAASAEMLNILRAALPEYETTTSTIKFLWVARIVDNPLYAMNLLASQMLSSQDVTTLRTYYPAIYQEMGQGLTDALLAEYKPEDTLPRRLKFQMSMFWQEPLMNVTTLAAYQMAEEKSTTQSAQPTGNAPALAQQEEKR